jgi:hypothetical protein
MMAHSMEEERSIHTIFHFLYKECLKYVMLFLTKSDRTAIFITLPRPLGLGFETMIYRP